MPATEYQRQVVQRLTEIIGRKPDYREFTQKPYLRVKWYFYMQIKEEPERTRRENIGKTIANYLLTNRNVLMPEGEGLQFKIPPTRDYKKPATRKRTAYQKGMIEQARKFWFERDDPEFDAKWIGHEKGELLVCPYSIGFKSDDIECEDVWMKFRSYERKDVGRHSALSAFLDWCQDQNLQTIWMTDYKLVVVIPKM